ncbi:MAG: hypothetical protein NT077_01805 [Candidatus Taylorbacteria bacterium]|nr:hypothetical protein [Candidatus Taylorbacteria bacterium]
MEKEKKVGPIVATLIIVLVLVIAALYLFASKINETPGNTPEENNLAGTVQTTPVPAPNSTEDLKALQSDLDSATTGLNSQNF